MIAFPVPGPATDSPLIGILFALAALTGFGVIVWQAVRWFRQDRQNRDGDDG